MAAFAQQNPTGEDEEDALGPDAFAFLIDSVDIRSRDDRSLVRKIALQMLVRGADPKRCTALSSILRAEVEDSPEGGSDYGTSTIVFEDDGKGELTDEELGDQDFLEGDTVQ